VKHGSWKKKEDLQNMKEIVAEFKRRMSTKVRRQKKLNIAEEKDFKRTLKGRATWEVYNKNVI